MTRSDAAILDTEPEVAIAQTAVEPAPHTAEQCAHGMRCLDTTGNQRVAVLMELVGALSRAEDPQEVLRVFSGGMTRLYGPRGYISLSTRGLKAGEYRITRKLLKSQEATRIHTADTWSAPLDSPVHRGGMLGELIRTAYPEVIHHLNVAGDPVLGDELKPFGSLMAIPLFDEGEPQNWAVMLDLRPEGFNLQELEETILRANLVGNTVKTKIITRQLREAHDSVRRQFEQVAGIQRALLPQTLPHMPGVSIATSYETFDTAGGDIYDFAWVRRRDDGADDETGPLAMLIADAAGHGPAAAVVTAMLNAILYAYPNRSDGPAALLGHANKHLSAKRLEGTFVTAFLCVYDPATRKLTYARAGHHPPLVKNPGADGSVRRLDAVGGLPLGVLDDASFETATVTLEPGQTIVMYTDGITEAQNLGGRMFGVEGIEAALARCTGEPACVVNSITSALREHEAGVRPSDDQTLVAVKFE